MDNAKTSAHLVSLGDTRTHNFDRPGDTDWIKFAAQAGVGYQISTSHWLPPPTRCFISMAQTGALS